MKTTSMTQHIKRNKLLYLMLLPGLIYFFLFKYLPMFGIIIAFQDYNPYTGILGSPFVGFQHFITFFSSPDFLRLLVNTMTIGFLKITIGFAFPIILALLLNEMRGMFYKRSLQTVFYLPHFISWTVVCSISVMLLAQGTGILDIIADKIMGQDVSILTSTTAFRPMILIQSIWKEAGWGTIIYLAALSTVDMEQHEAALIDGAGRFRRMWNITLPAIRSVIIVMLILNIGHFLSTGFDQIYLMTNAMNRSVADVFDTYVYTLGITQGAYSYSTAVGLFKSIVGIILIFTTNRIAKKIDPNSGLY